MDDVCNKNRYRHNKNIKREELFLKREEIWHVLECKQSVMDLVLFVTPDHAHSSARVKFQSLWL